MSHGPVFMKTIAFGELAPRFKAGETIHVREIMHEYRVTRRTAQRWIGDISEYLVPLERLRGGRDGWRRRDEASE